MRPHLDGVQGLSQRHSLRHLPEALSQTHFIFGQTNLKVGMPLLRLDLELSGLMGREGAWGQQGDTVCVNDIILIFQTRSCIERNISFGEMSINAEGIAGEKLFIKCYGIESCIPKEGLGIEQGGALSESMAWQIGSVR